MKVRIALALVGISLSVANCASNGLGYASEPRGVMVETGYCMETGNCTGNWRTGYPVMMEQYMSTYPISGPDAN